MDVQAAKISKAENGSTELTHLAGAVLMLQEEAGLRCHRACGVHLWWRPRLGRLGFRPAG